MIGFKTNRNRSWIEVADMEGFTQRGAQKHVSELYDNWSYRDVSELVGSQLSTD